MFIQSLGSPETKKSYLYHLGRFLKWNNLTDYDDLLNAGEKAIQRNLEDYILNSNTLKFTAIRKNGNEKESTKVKSIRLSLALCLYLLYG
jgi:hypothetical protein